MCVLRVIDCFQVNGSILFLTFTIDCSFLTLYMYVFAKFVLKGISWLCILYVIDNVEWVLSSNVEGELDIDEWVLSSSGEGIGGRVMVKLCWGWGWYSIVR